MCLAVPFKITAIDGKCARAEIDGVERNIRIDFVPNAEVGNYVIVHAGFAIEILDEELAKENLKTIREVADAFQE